MHTDPGTGANPNVGPTMDIEDFGHMIAFANTSAAMELLLSIKSAIRITSMALTECASAEARTLVTRLLHENLDLHAELTQMMLDKGWLKPMQLSEQARMDTVAADRTVRLAKLPLFKDRSKVLEAFDTPTKPQ